MDSSFIALALYGLGAAGTFGALANARARLALSRAKHRSLTGHVRMSRRVAGLIPFYEFDAGQRVKAIHRYARNEAHKLIEECMILANVAAARALGYRPAKAWLAQILIARAWDTAMATGKPAPPWPWADTTPVARLRVPALGVDQIVLAHATGRSLAFGPGHLDVCAAPGDPGLSVISGHRDTSFAILADLTAGTAIRIQRADGAWVDYRVTSTAIVDERTTRLAPRSGGPPQLALTTCYPFDAVLPGGPLRYVAWAEARP